MKSSRWIITIALVLLAIPARSQPLEPLDSSHLRLLLGKLNTVGSVLYIAAHPDDENTAMLAWLANGKLVRTGYLSLTRGDGGQNLIGTEKGDSLGVLRTEELLAARRIDGAEQFFTRAIDFGFTKSSDETLAIWGHDAVLSDVVWVIRNFRPDIIITRFPPDSRAGHGQHTASAILAEEAFKAAADPQRFPEQLLFVKPWQAKRLLWNVFRSGMQDTGATTVSVDLGAYNPLLGASYQEIAARSRSQHKSQGFGTAEQRGINLSILQVREGDPPQKDLFDGVDLTWNRIPGGAAVGEILRDAAAKYEAADPAAIVPRLLEADEAVNRLAPDPWIPMKRAQLHKAIASASGLWLGAVATTAEASRGSEVTITATAVNRSALPMTIAELKTPFDYVLPARETRIDATLANNVPFEKSLTVRIPESAEWSQPYWLREPEVMGGPNNSIAARYSVNDPQLIGRAENAPALPVTFALMVSGHPISLTVPVSFRKTDRVKGESYEPFQIVPAVTISAGGVYIFPDRKAKTISVTISAAGKSVSGDLRLAAPAGWKISPQSLPLSLESGEERTVQFAVTPPENQSAGTLSTTFVTGQASYSRGLTRIDYPHILPQTMLPPATSRLVRVDVKHAGTHVGYIMGPGDDVPAALRQVGYDVTLLTDAEIESGPLARYDTIIAGVRAFNVREALKRNTSRLMEYVKNGGTFIVQYNTPDKTVAEHFSPYPMKLSGDRVTVETASITLLAPQNALLTSPNAIGPSDFDSWVQERGLYFASEWDPHFTAIMASHDPGEKDLPGGTLVADYGKGKYIYTSYAWFRQLPAGVPGAYRLFANMVSAGHVK
ncbi:MAG: PIG-L family deacetylase [Acidobacteriota bacterium]